MFIPDPDPGSLFLLIPDLGVKKALDPGSGSATLVSSYWIRSIWQVMIIKLQQD
jgi:hypothetical protein